MKIKLLNFNTTDEKILKRNQNIVVFLAFSIFLVVSILFMIFSSGKKEIKIPDSKKINVKNTFNIDPQDDWLNRSENDLSIMNEKIKKLTEELEKEKERNQEEKEKYNKVIDSLASEVANVRSQSRQQPVMPDVNEYGEFNINMLTPNEITSVSLDLEIDNNVEIDNDKQKDIEDYLPAGSYATAKMLSGADVSTGVNNQNDPNNMMFEIISPAYLPKFNGTQQLIKKIKGCRIMGAASGQLWTEKAYIRLLKMTCSFEKGKILEFPVKGYVTSFGKEGVRGKVVSREGYFTSLAFISGAIEGLANVAEKVYSPTLEVSTGIATQSINKRDAMRQSLASGFGKSSEMLSDYYIKRAEQYQSVIDVPTGIEVEIVFTDGVDISATSKNQKVKKNENLINSQNVQNDDFMKDLEIKYNNKQGVF